MKTYNSTQILASKNLYDLQDSFTCSGIPFKYILTEGEIEWLKHIQSKYSIADWIQKNLEHDVLTFDDSEELSEALYDDGIPFKAVMLDDETALQKLFFWLNTND